MIKLALKIWWIAQPETLLRALVFPILAFDPHTCKNTISDQVFQITIEGIKYAIWNNK